MGIADAVTMLEGLKTSLGQSIEAIDGETSRTLTQINDLQDAFPDIASGLGERLQELKTMYTQISQSLQEHQGFVGTLTNELNDFIARYRSGS